MSLYKIVSMYIAISAIFEHDLNGLHAIEFRILHYLFKLVHVILTAVSFGVNQKPKQQGVLSVYIDTTVTDVTNTTHNMIDRLHYVEYMLYLTVC